MRTSLEPSAPTEMSEAAVLLRFPAGLALMGLALTILAKDLLMYEVSQSVTNTRDEIGLG